MSLRDEVAAIEAMVKCFVNGDVFVDEIWWLKRRSAAQSHHTKWKKIYLKQTVTGGIQPENFFKV
jgi:hypothetical protein